MSLMDVMTNGKNAMKAFDQALQLSTANMGNVETNGYKSLQYSFQTIFNDVLRGGSAAKMDGSGGTNPYQTGSSVGLAGVSLDFNQGEMKEGNDMNMAILGTGMYAVSEDGGNTFLYTRNSEFSFDSSGYVVDPQGRVVYGYKIGEDGAPMTNKLVPIKNDGFTDVGWEYKSDSGKLIAGYSQYKYARENGMPPTETKGLYQVALTTFQNRSGLIQNDGTTFKSTIASGDPMPFMVSGGEYGNAYSQTIEESNVFYVGEMLEALGIQRAMQASLTAVKMANQQIQNVVQQLGS